MACCAFISLFPSHIVSTHLPPLTSKTLGPLPPPDTFKSGLLLVFLFGFFLFLFFFVGVFFLLALPCLALLCFAVSCFALLFFVGLVWFGFVLVRHCIALIRPSIFQRLVAINRLIG